MAAAAVLTGARSMVAIAEWAAAARPAGPGRARRPPRGPGPLGGAGRGHHPPDPGRLDAEALTRAIAAWLADREGPDQHRRRRAVAVDGKTLRGARRDGRQVHLLAAMEHTSRKVLAQREVDGAPARCLASNRCLATST
jgi:hypothetical protein